MDRFSRSQRSAVMARVKSKHTAPEMLVRRTAHALGFRFRLHRKDLPGNPDLVFAGKRKAIFVNGCFWHGHGCPRGARKPVNNAAYWSAKIARNVERDQRNKCALRSSGWRSLILWECELKDSAKLKRRLKSFLRD